MALCRRWSHHRTGRSRRAVSGAAAQGSFADEAMRRSEPLRSLHFAIAFCSFASQPRSPCRWRDHTSLYPNHSAYTHNAMRSKLLIAVALLLADWGGRGSGARAARPGVSALALAPQLYPEPAVDSSDRVRVEFYGEGARAPRRGGGAGRSGARTAPSRRLQRHRHARSRAPSPARLPDPKRTPPLPPASSRAQRSAPIGECPCAVFVSAANPG